MFYGTMKESRRKATALQGGGGKRGKVQTAFISSGTRTSTPCFIFHSSGTNFAFRSETTYKKGRANAAKFRQTHTDDYFIA